MKFVVHDYHNNNSYPVGNFKSQKKGAVFIPPVYITNEGITFFMLPKVSDIDERIKTISSLHGLLKQNFSHGISAVTCAQSDCVDSDQFEPLFKAVKAIDKTIRTVEITALSYGKSPNADYNVDDMLDRQRTHATILQAVAPTANDNDAPSKGWRVYENKLNDIYLRALDGEVVATRPNLLSRLRSLIKTPAGQ